MHASLVTVSTASVLSAAEAPHENVLQSGKSVSELLDQLDGEALCGGGLGLVLIGGAEPEVGLRQLIRPAGVQGARKVDCVKGTQRVHEDQALSEAVDRWRGKNHSVP